MLQHAVRIRKKNPLFNGVTEQVREKAVELMSGESTFLSAGGQRDDWFFSGIESIPHISMYKNGKMEMVDDERVFPIPGRYLHEVPVLPIFDVLTEGHSTYRTEDGAEKGWIPMLREKGAVITDVLVVANRWQGGEKVISDLGINVHSLVNVDKLFLRRFSPNAERDVKYHQNPSEWSVEYLREHGAMALLPQMNAADGRAKRFLQRYDYILSLASQRYIFDHAVQQEYGKSLDNIMEGNK
tara:strand:- start:6857 stop:7579 length:723 start_codon:yes stop_codon:yes gene_type:complete